MRRTAGGAVDEFSPEESVTDAAVSVETEPTTSALPAAPAGEPEFDPYGGAQGGPRGSVKWSLRMRRWQLRIEDNLVLSGPGPPTRPTVSTRIWKRLAVPDSGEPRDRRRLVLLPRLRRLLHRNRPGRLEPAQSMDSSGDRWKLI